MAGGGGGSLGRINRNPERVCLLNQIEMDSLQVTFHFLLYRIPQGSLPSLLLGNSS